VSPRQSRQHDALPLADYDQLRVGELQHRVRSLDSGELEVLLRHEREHADRAPVRQVLQARLDQVRSGSPPSPGGGEGTPERSAPPPDRSKVSPASSPEPIGPSPHGSPAQSAKPKANRAR
jgi:hypothetical protein